jgi:hypothetical protein
MSTGIFVESVYQASFDGSFRFPIRIQPETLILNIGGVTNNPPTGGTVIPIHAKVSKGDREYGIRPALVRFAWNGSAPAGYDQDSILTLPLLNSTIKAATGIGVGGSYLSADIIVTDFIAEDTN